MVLIGIILVLFIIAFLMLLNLNFFRSHFVWLLSIIPLFLFFYFAHFIPRVMDGTIIFYTINWFPLIDVSISLSIDGLSLLFALLITGIGTLIVIYSISYLENNSYLSRYFCYLFLFMAAMLGVVLADNLITLFVCWEITSVSSYLLIGFNHERASARKAALNALLITSSGALFLLVGFLLIGIAAHTYSIAELLSQGHGFVESKWYPVILLLVFIGAFTKSAQFPFHFWLPNAMEAPTPISAYLHSATMVQAGVYLLARFHPVMASSALWFITLTTIGAITMVAGVLLAFKQKDMKLILAYTTVTAMGSLVFLLGSDQEAVIKAAVAFLISHALYKATLFMVVGDIQHQAGTRQVTRVSGLYKAMPVTFMAALVAGASMAGLPPLLGFYVKELVYEANLAAPIASYILTAMVVFANMMVASLAFILIIKPFFGKQKPNDVLEANKKMSLNALMLAVFTLIISIVPFIINKAILSPAASAILGHPVQMELTMWHGFTPSLALSLITLLGAIILYLKRAQVKQLLNLFDVFSKYSPTYGWQQLIRGTLIIADWQTNILQSGKQRIYLTIIFSTVALCLVVTSITQHAIKIEQLFPSISWLPMFLFSWIFVSALFTVWVDTYLKGLIFLGMLGLGVALLFLVNAAPDVAMTQVLVETLIVIIVVLNFYRQPVLPNIVAEKKSIRLINMIIAITIGMSITLLLLTITHQYFDPKIGNYFLKNSVILAHGHNVVNVILVDFRALDTLGEIIVVATAAIGIYALLKTGKKGKKL
ncbi:putative monovalent cation/H+ antiporter subunit A [Legionella tucsonensis]|uniref:NADH-quinone oxidoreductase chain L n=1 Tax=Legionella tucsonensis TaxID=40335 RepID=A0A0W0ZQB4_9GAMM|nr:putative monovalent cation/H+ antiporter subunit A [Legionella tucsonensis]KTD71208.1 NADH-quinone oxidoreductase chain L [Legionella tucsonensis]